MDDYFHKTEIKTEEENADTNKQFTEALVTELKSIYDKTTFVGKSFKLNETGEDQTIKIEIGETDEYYYKSIIQIEENNDQMNELQKPVDDNACEVFEEKFKVELKNETDDFNSCHKNKIDEEKEDIKEHFPEDLVIKPSPTCFENSYNCYEAVQNDLYKTLEGISYNVEELCNERIVKVEMDLMHGHVESLIEIEENVLLDVQTTNCDLDELQPFVCDICKKSFATKRRVAKHISHLHSAKSTTEENTGKQGNENNLIVNQTTVGVAEGYTGNIRRPYKFDICLKTFLRKYHVTQHKRVHTGEKPYKCDICSKTFPQKSHVTQHKRVHTGEKPFKYKVCLQLFSHKSNLKPHERLHNGEKPYKCAICYKHFSQNSNLKTHTRLHTGEMPFKCNVFLQLFSLKGDLKKHEREHDGEKPYKSNICSK